MITLAALAMVSACLKSLSKNLTERQKSSALAIHSIVFVTAALVISGGIHFLSPHPTNVPQEEASDPETETEAPPNAEVSSATLVNHPHVRSPLVWNDSLATDANGIAELEISEEKLGFLSGIAVDENGQMGFFETDLAGPSKP